MDERECRVGAVNEKYHILSVPAGGYHMFVGTIAEAQSECRSREGWGGHHHVVGSFLDKEVAEDFLFEKLGWFLV